MARVGVPGLAAEAPVGSVELRAFEVSSFDKFDATCSAQRTDARLSLRALSAAPTAWQTFGARWFPRDHDDRSQSQRTAALAGFDEGRFKVPQSAGRNSLGKKNSVPRHSASWNAPDDSLPNFSAIRSSSTVQRYRGDCRFCIWRLSSRFSIARRNDPTR
jgi:hypothetical protein